MTAPLDFLVIGAQKAGTTTLWQLLRGHPQLAFPPAKEAPFFTEDSYERGVEWFARTVFGDAAAGRLRGTVTPHYMLGTPDAPVPLVAARIARDLPDVRLIALLRDPVERAVSHWRMSRRRGIEPRGVDEALREELTGGALAEARQRPTSTNSYIAQGEYGRILGEYLRHLPRERLLVELTDHLARDPGAVLGRVLRFLGVEADWRPGSVDGRWFVGGEQPRITPEASDALYHQLLRDVFPLAGAAHDDVAHGFWLAFQQWNVVPEEPPVIDADLEDLLRTHFASDAERLAELLEVTVPWSDHRARRDGEPAGSSRAAGTTAPAVDSSLAAGGSARRPTLTREEATVASGTFARVREDGGKASGSDSARYDFDIDLDSRSVHTDVLALVGESHRVLELGPATGYMTRVMRERGNRVVAIELDEEMARHAEPHCERLIVGDLEDLDLAAEFGEDRFDVIVAADVLEHLRDPLGHAGPAARLPR